MVLIPTNQIEVQDALRMEDGIFIILAKEHVKPGKGPAYMQVKLKNVETGRVIERRLRTADQVDRIEVERHPCIFSYREGETYIFLHAKTFELYEVPAEMLGNDTQYLVENQEVTIIAVEDQVLGVELPASVVLTVTECDPGVKHATATHVFKHAVVETGISVAVPSFINPGDRIKIDTVTGKYIERASIG